MEKTTMDDVKNMLTEITYPTKKQDLLKAAKDNSIDEEIIRQINGLQDKEYMTSGDVMKELNMETLDKGM